MDETKNTMNERIKELAEQANLKLDDLPDDTFIPLEKFAELIVQECAGIVQNQGAFSRFDVLANKIKTHFGVKK